MGVSGLWAHLKKAGQDAKFEKLALEVFDEAYTEHTDDGRDLSTNPPRGLRVGVDASAWFFHSELSDGGANPELRTLFHRVIRMAKCGVRALFVFDGPHRPAVKRGNHIFRGEQQRTIDFKQVVEAFGYEWRTAPGEAEAELAMLNHRGDIDLVISDDVDSLLFGASSVMKHAFIAKPTESIKPSLYSRGYVEMETGLTVPGIILVALMAGGDYDSIGLPGIGATIAIALAQAGFGETLLQLVCSLRGKALQERLVPWRDQIRHELTTNESGLFPRKNAAKAKNIPDTWPDMSVMTRYLVPVTSALPAYASFHKPLSWSSPIDIENIVYVLDHYFEFTHQEIMHKFRNQISELIVIHRLIYSTGTPLANDNQPQLPSSHSTPTKGLAAAMAKFDFASPDKTSLGQGGVRSTVPSSLAGILLRVEKARANNTTSVTPELQVIIDPSQIVDEVKRFLRHPDPNVGKLETRKLMAASEAALMAVEANPDLGEPDLVIAKARNYNFVDPYEAQKLWIQTSLLRMAVPALVTDWEQREREKADKKANKGKKTATSPQKKVSPTKVRSKLPKEPSTKAAVHSQVSAATSAKVHDDSDDDDHVFASSSANAVPSSSYHLSPPKPRHVARPSASSPSSAESSNKSKILREMTDSDSDVEVITSASRSPKKSPRLSESARTARTSAATQSSGTAQGLREHVLDTKSDVKAKPSQSKSQLVKPAKRYEYRQLSDEDSEDDLPSLIPSRGIVPPASKKGTGAGQQLQYAGDKVVERRKPTTAANHEVIDLCSSD